MLKLAGSADVTLAASRLRGRLARVAVCMFAALTVNAGAADPAELFRLAVSATRTVDHLAWDRLLKTYVKSSGDGINRVDYTSFKRSGHSELKAYLSRLETVDPGTLDRAEQFAFLANLYNAKTIDIVLDKYPVNSIKDISLGGGLVAAFSGGPWKAKVLKLGGSDFSLDDIEHGILRPVFKDPRVHYAVNCASIGCPNLQMEAFTGARLSAQLDAAARAYINQTRGANVVGGKLVVSSIYNWFKADFGGNDAGVLKHLRTYAAPALAEKLKAISSIGDHAYDWHLNDVRN